MQRVLNVSIMKHWDTEEISVNKRCSDSGVDEK